MKIPVIINNKNLLTWPAKMVSDLKTFDNIGDIIIVDNGSTYEPLLEWYNEGHCEVILTENWGQSGPWNLEIPSTRNYQNYVVTDPDMDFSETPKDCLNYLLEKLNKYPEYCRIGLSLSNYDVSIDSPYHYHLKTWYENAWREDSKMDGLLTKQLFDTTFGMYDLRRSASGISCCTDKPYSAKHIPWDITNSEIKNLKEKNYEFYYYLVNATSSSSYKNFISFKP